MADRMIDEGADVRMAAAQKPWSLYIGTIHGDLVIRMHDQATIQMDLISWLSRNGLLAELKDKGDGTPKG